MGSQCLLANGAMTPYDRFLAGSSICAFGHEPPVADPPEQSFEWLLDFETCRLGYACNSALWSAPHKADYVDRTIMWTTEVGRHRMPCVSWLFDD